MEEVKIVFYESSKAKPEFTITIPISALHIAKDLIPTKPQKSLEREGIDISGLSRMIDKKVLKGKVIEVETQKEKIVISIS